MQIQSEATFAAICEASPLQASSGNRSHHRLNRGGNRQANATLHRIALLRLRWHGQGKAYAKRRKAEGLSNKDSLHCLQLLNAQAVFDLMMGKPPRDIAAACGMAGCSNSEPQPKPWDLTCHGNVILKDVALDHHSGLSPGEAPELWCANLRDDKLALNGFASHGLTGICFPNLES